MAPARRPRAAGAAPRGPGAGTCGKMSQVSSPGTRSAEQSTADDALARVAAGELGAFTELYDMLSPAVHGTALSVLRDPDHAAEVTQEVMVEIWRTASRWDARRGSARAWATTMAHRRAVDRVRSVQAQRTRDQAVLDGDRPRDFDVVAEQAESNLEARRVRHCLGGLTDTQREAVVLAYYDGRTYREVAESLAAPLPTVKSRIRDGLTRLRDCLGVAA